MHEILILFLYICNDIYRASSIHQHVNMDAGAPALCEVKLHRLESNCGKKFRLESCPEDLRRWAFTQGFDVKVVERYWDDEWHTGDAITFESTKTKSHGLCVKDVCYSFELDSTNYIIIWLSVIVAGSPGI